MKLDSNKQESSDLKVFGVGPKDSEIKSEFTLKSLTLLVVNNWWTPLPDLQALLTVILHC